MYVNGISNCQLLHVIVSGDDLFEICHVNPFSFGEVAFEGRLSVHGIEDWRNLEFSRKHEGLTGLTTPFLCIFWDLEEELNGIKACTSIDCGLKQASVH